MFLEVGAALAAARGDAQRAATLWGATDTISQAAPLGQSAVALRAEWEARARDAIAATAEWDAAYIAGTEISGESAVALARSLAPRLRSVL